MNSAHRQSTRWVALGLTAALVAVAAVWFSQVLEGRATEVELDFALQARDGDPSIELFTDASGSPTCQGSGEFEYLRQGAEVEILGGDPDTRKGFGALQAGVVIPAEDPSSAVVVCLFRFEGAVESAESYWVVIDGVVVWRNTKEAWAENGFRYSVLMGPGGWGKDYSPSPSPPIRPR